MKQTISPNLASLCHLTKATAEGENEKVGRDDLNLDWNAIITLAERHRVEGIVAGQLDQMESPVPTAVRRHFESKLKRQGLEALLATRGLSEIHAAFSMHGIEYLVLKGLSISERFYNSRSERHSIDIDILINEPSIDQAISTLRALGFESHIADNLPPRCERIICQVRKDIRFFRPRDGLAVELHWRLTANPLLLPWKFQNAIAYSEALKISGIEHRVLKPPALLLYLICHGTAHSWFRLKWLADIQRIRGAISEMERRETIDLVGRHGCERILAASIHLADGLYGAIPDVSLGLDASHGSVVFMHNFMKRSITTEVAEEAVSTQSFRDYALRLRYEWLFRTDLRYRTKVLSRRLVSYEEVMRFRLSHRWYGLYLIAGPATQIVIKIRNILFHSLQRIFRI